MPSVTFEYRNEAERIAIERAVAFVGEMHSLAQATPDGQVLHSLEGHTLDAGREFLRTLLQNAAQDRIDDAEKEKGGPPAAAARAPAPSASSEGARGTS